MSTTLPVADPDDGFAEFVRGSQTRMVHLAELLTRDRGRAEDLAQHAYAKAYASWPRVSRGDPEAYVRRCIVNANVDWWRRRTWHERPSEVLPEAAQRGGDPAASAADRDLVLRALSRLTDRERTVIALRFYLDMSEVQVASELGIRPGTVKSTTARALAKLRQDAELRSETTP
ncbi:MAG: SigE family RNA polymerase sigma factor [Catenulispora sp.]